MSQPSQFPLSESSQPTKLRKDEELKKLKAGDIYVDEEGKKYRVHKTFLPQRWGGGPAGLGDPNDRTLRHVEQEVLIPNLMRKRLDKIECRHTLDTYVECVNEQRSVRTCKPLLEFHKDCLREKFKDPEFINMITELFLKERREFRLTGKGKLFRMLDEHKQKEGENSGNVTSSTRGRCE